MKKAIKVIIFIVAAVWIFGKLFGTSHQFETVVAGAVGSSTKISPSASSCEIGSPADGGVVAVTGEFYPRTTPSDKGDKIKNEKASAALGETHYHQIDFSTTVRQLCAEGDWSEIQIVTPDWLTHVKGWVPNKVLRGIERTASGTRVYVESDFYWDKDASKYKKQIVTIVNKIAQEHKGCSDLDAATVFLSPTKSKQKKPVFSVTCKPSGANMFNVSFSPSDTGKTFTAPAAIGQGDAVLACERAAKAAAAHPSTVDFSRFMDVSFRADMDGSAILQSSFTAKNGFNLELKYKIQCLFEGGTLTESNIVEAR